MKNCKVCGKEIAIDAKVCPNCGHKDDYPFYMKASFWILVSFFVIGIFGSANTETKENIDNNTNNEYTENNNIDSDKNINDIPSEEVTETIEYLKINIDKLENDLETNAAVANETYTGKYIETTGKLSTIDADLKYITIVSTTNSLDFFSIKCNVRNQDTEDIIKTLHNGQAITVRGKITKVSDILGYYLNIDEIIVN